MVERARMSANELPGPGEFGRIVKVCPCGGMRDRLGRVLLVTAVIVPPEGYAASAKCSSCGVSTPSTLVAFAGCDDDECFPRQWLRREPPMRELLEEIEREAIPA
jgi:hypothetical protein